MYYKVNWKKLNYLSNNTKLKQDPYNPVKYQTDNSNIDLQSQNIPDM